MQNIYKQALSHLQIITSNLQAILRYNLTTLCNVKDLELYLNKLFKRVFEYVLLLDLLPVAHLTPARLCVTIV